MKNLKKYYIFSLAGVLLISFYPLYMGIQIVSAMIRDRVVLAENYPKYIIPYTPISLAVITAVLIMPILMKHARKYSLPLATSVSLIIFFVSELLLENMVIVSDNAATKLESWQMYMCYVSPENFKTRTWRAVDVLIGDYSPAFKIHFYFISVVLIISLLNCIYGYARIIVSNDKCRLKALVIQSIATALFLGLCILACFTAFFRGGEITVSAVSAVLMSLFFSLIGITTGVYVGSFLVSRKKVLSVLLPSVIASLAVLIMYIGEMVLLSGHLYRFGSGFLFEGLDGIVLAPADILIIIASGCINAAICNSFGNSSRLREEKS